MKNGRLNYGMDFVKPKDNFSDARASSATGSLDYNDWRTAPSGKTASWEVFHFRAPPGRQP
jgi:hypothetical protein